MTLLCNRSFVNYFRCQMTQRLEIALSVDSPTPSPSNPSFTFYVDISAKLIPLPISAARAKKLLTAISGTPESTSLRQTVSLSTMRVSLKP
jgi:hypothetical protein